MISLPPLLSGLTRKVEAESTRLVRNVVTTARDGLDTYSLGLVKWQPDEKWVHPPPTAPRTLPYVLESGHVSTAEAERTLAQARDDDHPRTLNATQEKALELFGTHAKTASAAAWPALLKKAARFGCVEADVKRVLTFLRDDAPARIHFPAQSLGRASDFDHERATVLSGLAEQGAYRNQYETLRSQGDLSPYLGGRRDGYEAALFDGVYHEHALVPGERPLYGALDAEGANCGELAKRYGRAALELGPGIRSRLTVTPNDSFRCTTGSVGTLEHAVHVLADEQMSMHHLRCIFEHVLEGKTDDDSNNYLEIQVHGPVDLKRDVSAVLFPKSDRAKHEAEYQAFAERFGLELRWVDG